MQRGRPSAPLKGRRHCKGLGAWRLGAEYERASLATITAERKTEPRVQRIGGRIILPNLDMQRQGFPLPALGEHRMQRRRSRTLTPIFWSNKEIVDECVGAAIFHAEAQSKDHMANNDLTARDKPNSAQGWIAYERAKAMPGPLAIEGVAGLSVKLRHEVHELCNVLERRSPRRVLNSNAGGRVHGRANV